MRDRLSTQSRPARIPQAFTHLALIRACHALDPALDGAWPSLAQA